MHDKLLDSGVLKLNMFTFLMYYCERTIKWVMSPCGDSMPPKQTHNARPMALSGDICFTGECKASKELWHLPWTCKTSRPDAVCLSVSLQLCLSQISFVCFQREISFQHDWVCSFWKYADLFFYYNAMFLAEAPEMPVGTPAPLNKRKKAPKIITDLAHITQDGKINNPVCGDLMNAEDW